MQLLVLMVLMLPVPSQGPVGSKLPSLTTISAPRQAPTDSNHQHMLCKMVYDFLK
jgi:hypothetical protein